MVNISHKSFPFGKLHISQELFCNSFSNVQYVHDHFWPVLVLAAAVDDDCC